jgi:glutaredoxin
MAGRLVLYTRARCGLCDELLAGARPIAGRFGFDIETVDIDRDPELARRYNTAIPVLELDGTEIARYHLDADALERALATAPDT